MKLHYNTVTTLLKNTLDKLMTTELLFPFRLVGGTALSLQIGHRFSIDIDLFTDAKYKSIDFSAIENYLKREFNYVDSTSSGEVAFGKSFYIGNSAQECVKLDLFYTDAFIRDASIIDGIRLATIEEIAAMKIDVIQRGGRKKDFWDIHELLNDYSIQELLSLHEERYPYTHDKEEIISMFTNFKIADNDFNPICLLHKHWEIIRLDITEAISEYKINNTIFSAKR